MAIELDHILIPVPDRVAAARLLGSLLAVPWSESGVGPFSPVYLNAGLTLDFDQADSTYPVQHYCFRVGEDDFDAIVARIRAAGIACRSNAHGPADGCIGSHGGGRLVYWNEPGGHCWELLTLSYARQPLPSEQRRARSGAA